MRKREIAVIAVMLLSDWKMPFPILLPPSFFFMSKEPLEVLSVLLKLIVCDLLRDTAPQALHLLPLRMRPLPHAIKRHSVATRMKTAGLIGVWLGCC